MLDDAISAELRTNGKNYALDSYANWVHRTIRGVRYQQKTPRKAIALEAEKQMS